MRRSLLNKPNLLKSLRQELVLFTLLLLPSAAWGDTVFTTGEYDASVSSWIVINKNKGEAAGNWVPYGTAEGVTYAANSTNSSYLDLTFEAIQAGGTASNITFKFENSNFGKIKELLVEYDAEAASPSFSLTIGGQPSGASTTSNTGSFTFSFTDAKEWESLELKIEKWETSASVSSTIKSIAITTDQVSYNLNIGGIEVTNTNADNITGDGITLGTDGKVSFIPGEGDNPGTLTLNNATIGGDIISQALTINLVGNNTISGKIHPSGSVVSEGELAFTGTENSSLTINASVGSAAIYNYTSVNFGSYKLTTSTSPGVYYNSDYHNLWTDHIGDGSSASNVTLTTKTIYPLWIGNSTYTFIQVTEENKSNILEDSKISFDGTNTLTLSEATLVGSIISGLSGGLTIVVDKENFINMTSTAGDSILTRIRNIAPNASLTIKKSNNEGNCSLVVNGPIKNFSSISYENGIYLSSAKDGLGNDLNPAFIYYNYSGGFQYTDNSTIKSLTFSTTKPSESIWIGTTEVGENGKFGDIENVEFEQVDGINILTLNEADLTGDIISSLPNLTIKLKKSSGSGLSSISSHYIISSNPSATLTFTTDGGGSLTSSIGNYGFPWKGFSGNPTFENKLVFTQAAGTEKIEVLSAPTMSYTSSGLTFSGLSDGYQYVFDCYYSITYEDGNGNVEGEKYYPGENPNVPLVPVSMEEKPCTVTAYVTYTDIFENTTISETAIGKYFGFADKTIVFSSTTSGSELKASDLELSPATEGVSIAIIDAYNSDVISYNAGTGATIVGIGACNIDIKINANEGSNIQILNTPTLNPDSPGQQTVYIITKEVTVIPDKPSIEKDAEHDYIETDKITITRTSVEGEVADNLKIFYIWSDDEVEVKTYQPYVDGGSVSIYSEPIAAQTGTLRAWVGYHAGDNYYYNSEVVSEKFIVYEVAEMEWESETQTYGTFYNPDKDMAVPTGSTAYIVTGISEDGTSVTISPVSYIKAGVAVLIERGKTTEVSKTTDFSASKMEYSNPDTPAKPSSTDNWYVIYNNKFVKVTTGTEVKGGKCYLNLNSTPAGTRGFYNIGDGEGTTAIREVIYEGVNSEKLADGAWHDLQGRKFTTKPTKPGLYILNGKKIVIK